MISVPSLNLTPLIARAFASTRPSVPTIWAKNGFASRLTKSEAGSPAASTRFMSSKGFERRQGNDLTHALMARIYFSTLQGDSCRLPAMCRHQAAVPGLAQDRERLEDAAADLEAGRQPVRYPVWRPIYQRNQLTTNRPRHTKYLTRSGRDIYAAVNPQFLSSP